MFTCCNVQNILFLTLYIAAASLFTLCLTPSLKVQAALLVYYSPSHSLRRTRCEQLSEVACACQETTFVVAALLCGWKQYTFRAIGLTHDVQCQK